MSFDEKYAALEDKFKQQVAKDNQCWSVTSKYLPNIAPTAPVDFVLIGMEPSSGGNSKGYRSPKNFSGSFEDFILHFCIKEYLCKSNETYYLTDLSKGAMLVKTAKRKREERYEGWYPLLCRELKLVAKPGAQIIAIGNEVHGFITKKKSHKLAGKILHYSKQATPHRSRIPDVNRDLYDKFAPTVSRDDIEKTIRRIATEGGMPGDYAEGVSENLKGQTLTVSRKMLMFTYQVQFDAVRKEAGLL